MKLFVGLMILWAGCKAADTHPETSSDAVESARPRAQSSAAPAATAPAGKETQRATIGGKPLQTVTAPELVAAARSAGWSTVDNAPASDAVMRSESSGRESLTVAFTKGATTLAVLIVRPVPGKTVGDDSIVSNAKTTVQAFEHEATYLEGEMCVVVSARPGMGENPSKAAKDELLSALVKR